MKAKFEQPGTYAKPGLLGRTVRLLAGVAIFYLVFPPFIRHYEAFTRVRAGWEMPGGTWWIAPLLTLFLLPHLFEVGFGLGWGRRSQVGFGLLMVTAVAMDFVLYGSFWGPPLGWFLIGSSFLVLGHLAISFLVAAAFATPG